MSSSDKEDWKDLAGILGIVLGGFVFAGICIGSLLGIAGLVFRIVSGV